MEDSTTLSPDQALGQRPTRRTTPSPGHSRTPSVRRAETDDSEKAGRVWARTVDDPWWPSILTLDGGGIRGYSSLIILKALMHEVWLCEQRLDAEEERDHDSLQPHERSEQALAGSGSDDARPENSEVDGASNDSPTDLLKADNMTTERTKRKAITEEELLPCHYFDFMYGTSTGGLIATMLGRLRMTVTECLELYRKVGDDLFGKRRSSMPLATKYDHRPLEKAVQDIVGSRCHEHKDCNGKNDTHPWQLDIDPVMGVSPFNVDQPRVCQSCCLTATHDESLSEAYLLRTYPHYYAPDSPNWITRYNEGADELKIWQVTRATSAAPFYFKMLEAEIKDARDGRRTLRFKDGGIRENNPSGAALSEFYSLYDGKADRPALLLSVGTGRPDHRQDGFASAWPGPFGHISWVRQLLEKRAVVQNLLIKYTEGEKQHLQMREHAHGENTWYKRLNVTDGLQNMPLDDWVKGPWHGKEIPGGASLTRMEEATLKYLERDFNPEPNIDTYAAPKTMLCQAAEKLVRQRRAREEEGGVRWDTFIGKFLHRAHESADVDAHVG